VINKQYDILTKQLDDKAAAIKDTYTQTTALLKDQRDQQQKVTDSINAVALEASKNGASPSILQAIQGAKTYSDAIAAAGDSLQSATGTLGDYLQYKKDTIAKGLVPSDYQTYKDAQDKKAANLKVSEASAIAYAQAKAKAQADKEAGVLSSSQQTLLTGTETRMQNNPIVKNFDQVSSQYVVVNSVPNGTTDPVKQEALMLAIAQIYVPGAKTVRGVLSALKPEDMQSGVWNKLNDAEQIFSTKGSLSPDAVNSLKADASTIYNQNKSAYDSLRSETVNTLKARGIDNPDAYLTNLSNVTRVDPKSSVNDYIASLPKDSPDVESIAKMYEVSGATDQQIYDDLKARGKIK
jgi:hypothetical protein